MIEDIDILNPETENEKVLRFKIQEIIEEVNKLLIAHPRLSESAKFRNDANRLLNSDQE